MPSANNGGKKKYVQLMMRMHRVSRKVATGWWNKMRDHSEIGRAIHLARQRYPRLMDAADHARRNDTV